MSIISFLLYNLFFIPLFFVLIRIISLFNEKVSSGLRGRRNLFQELKHKMDVLPKASQRIWIHISSLGEFEQGKPVILNLKKRFPKSIVILSFFSPSAFKNVSSFPEADIICYIPIDSYWYAKKFVRMVRPSIALVVRHDIWPNHQWQLQKMNIPSVLLDASISDKKRTSFMLLRPFLKPIYGSFSEVLAISQESAHRLQAVFPHANRLHVCGDTRYDQVYRRVKEKGKIDHLISSGYFKHDRTFVAGSTWPSDERYLLPAISVVMKKHRDFVVIIAPHEPTEMHVSGIASFFEQQGIQVARYSKICREQSWDFSVVIIDSLGLLANLYALGQLAFVGGSFGPGVHSVLEPAAHGCAVLFGPRHLNSVEATQIVRRGGARAVVSADQIISELTTYLENPVSTVSMGNIALKMVQENIGASERTVDIIAKYLETEQQANENG